VHAQFETSDQRKAGSDEKSSRNRFWVSNSPPFN
jgi:hypothetical protein